MDMHTLARRLALALAFAALLPAILPAAPLTLKIASGAPANSPIGEAMVRLAAEFSRISGGQVLLKIYHGSSLGDSESLKQKMKTGLLDGALFTSASMATIVQDFMSLSAPGAVQDQAEFDFVFQSLKPFLEAKVEEKEFVSLAMVPAGWLRFFTRHSVYTPDDLRKLKLAVSSGDQALFQILKQLNLKVEMVPGTTILQKLQSKSIDAFYMNPVYFSYQWSSFSSSVPWMTDLPLAPFLGCLIVKSTSWKKVPAQYREALMAASQQIGVAMGKELQEKEISVIRELRGYGLKVATPTPAQMASWREEFSRALDAESGEAFPKETLAKVRTAVAEYRASKKP